MQIYVFIFTYPNLIWFVLYDWRGTTPKKFYLSQIKLSIAWLAEFCHFSESDIQIKKRSPPQRGTPTKEKQTKQKYNKNELSFSDYCECLYQMSYIIWWFVHEIWNLCSVCVTIFDGYTFFLLVSIFLFVSCYEQWTTIRKRNVVFGIFLEMQFAVFIDIFLFKVSSLLCDEKS